MMYGESVLFCISLKLLIPKHGYTGGRDRLINDLLKNLKLLKLNSLLDTFQMYQFIWRFFKLFNSYGKLNIEATSIDIIVRKNNVRGLVSNSFGKQNRIWMKKQEYK